MITDCKSDTLMPIIRRRVTPDSVVYSDTFASYNNLASEGYHRVRINHDAHLAEPGGWHINGIENFWGYSGGRPSVTCGSSTAWRSRASTCS